MKAAKKDENQPQRQPCHEFRFVRNIYGDEINLVNARSWWMCSCCGKWQARRELNEAFRL